MGCKSCCFASSAALAFLGLVVAATLHMLAWYDHSKVWGLLPQRSDEIWQKFESLEIFNTNWIQYIWLAVYICQLPWIMYSFQLLCSDTKTGPLYKQPCVMPKRLFYLFVIGLAGVIGWLFLWTSNIRYEFCTLCLMASCLVLYLTLAMSLIQMKRYENYMLPIYAFQDIWMIRVLVHNGIGLLCSWTTVVMLLNVAISLHSHDLLDTAGTSYAFLGVFMGYALVWFLIDSFVARDQLEGLITPYMVCIVQLVMVVDQTRHILNPTFMVSTICLGFLCVITISKAVVTIGRNIRQSIHD